MILGIIIGLFIVGCVAVVVMAILRMAKEERERAKAKEEAAKRIASYYSKELLQNCTPHLVDMKEYKKITRAKTIEFRSYNPLMEEESTDDEKVDRIC